MAIARSWTGVSTSARKKAAKDPTIREKFDAYRFVDHNEKVAKLFGRAARVSIESMEIVEALQAAPS